MAEDTALGEKVGQVRLADPGKRLNLYIGGPLLLPKSSRVLNGSEYFRIEAETGKVFLDKSLSGLQGTRLMFSVNVYDGPIKASKDIAVHVASSVGLDMVSLLGLPDSFETRKRSSTLSNLVKCTTPV